MPAKASSFPLSLLAAGWLGKVVGLSSLLSVKASLVFEKYIITMYWAIYMPLNNDP